MLEFNAKYIKRRRGHRCNFIKIEKYKYILGKSIPPYTNLSLFLIISSKHYISHQKNLMKSAATMVFDMKVSQCSSFKKDNQVNSNFSIACDIVVVPPHKRYLSHSLTLSYWIRW